MSVLGSVKNRLRTWFLINQKRKLKLQKEEINKKTVKIEKQIINIEYKEEMEENIFVVGKKTKQENNLLENKTNLLTEEKKISLVFSKENAKPTEQSAPLSNTVPNSLKEENSKKNIENSILEHVKIYVSNTKQEINNLQKDLKVLETKQKNIKTKEEIERHENQLKEIKIKISDLKRKIDYIKENYELKGLEELGDNLLYEYIDNFKFKYPITDIDLLTEQCKLELNVLDKITDLEVKVMNTLDKEKDKKEKIELLENDYGYKKIEFEKLKYQEGVITNFLEKEEEYLKKLEKEVNNNTISYNSKHKLKLNENYLKDLMNLYAGIYVFPKSFLGAFVGAYLIKNSVTPLLKKAFYYKEFRNYYYVYTEYTKKQDENLSLIEDTNIMINTSLDALRLIKEDFKEKYKGFLDVDKYKEYLKKINNLIQTLEKQEKEIKKQKEKLLKNKEKNKQKLLKLEEYNNKI